MHVHVCMCKCKCACECVLGGVRRKTARHWCASLNAKGWSAAFTPGKSHIQLAVGNSGTESAVGNPETDLTALPDTLTVVADVAETISESDCDLDSFVPKLTRTRLEIWRENPNSISFELNFFQSTQIEACVENRKERRRG